MDKLEQFLNRRTQHSSRPVPDSIKPKLLMVISLHPFGANTESAQREAQARQVITDLCEAHGWACRFEYCYKDHEAGGEAWAKKKENRKQVEDFRANLAKRYLYHEPSFVLISGRYTALEFYRGFHYRKSGKRMSRIYKKSTLGDLYRCPYSDTSTRTIETVDRTVRCRLCPDLGWWGEEKIRLTQLPSGTWTRLLFDLGCYLSDAAHHPEARLEKVRMRQQLGPIYEAEGITKEFLDGKPIVRLREDREDEFSY